MDTVSGIKSSINRSWLFLFVVLFLGWSFDFLFWGQNWPAINVPVFIFLALTLGLAVLTVCGTCPPKSSILVYLPLIFFASMSAVRLEPFSVALSLLSCLFLIALLAIAYANKDWLKFDAVDYFLNFFEMYLNLFGGGLIYLVERRRHLAFNQKEGADSQALRHLVRGILIAAPLLLIFILLLTSADLVFSQKIGDLTELFWIEKIPEYLFRAAYILLLALFFAGLLLYAAGCGRVEKMEVKKPASPKPFLGMIETSIVLGSILTLFLTFVLIQLQYFFGGERNIEGHTYAEYARRGFGELVAVAVIILLLLLVFGVISRRQSKKQQTVYALLSAGIVGMVIVMLISAFQRLMLYEDAYGFSRLRTYPHVFMVWLGALLLGLLILEIIQRQRFFLRLALVTAIGFSVTINVINIDGFIASRNVVRTQQGNELDVSYLETLSYDAVPALADLSRNQGLSEAVREQIREALLAYQEDLQQQEQSSWKSFNFSRRRAENALASLSD